MSGQSTANTAIGADINPRDRAHSPGIDHWLSPLRSTRSPDPESRPGQPAARPPLDNDELFRRPKQKNCKQEASQIVAPPPSQHQHQHQQTRSRPNSSETTQPAASTIIECPNSDQSGSSISACHRASSLPINHSSRLYLVQPDDQISSYSPFCQQKQQYQHNDQSYLEQTKTRRASVIISAKSNKFPVTKAAAAAAAHKLEPATGLANVAVVGPTRKLATIVQPNACQLSLDHNLAKSEPLTGASSNNGRQINYRRAGQERHEQANERAACELGQLQARAQGCNMDPRHRTEMGRAHSYSFQASNPYHTGAAKFVVDMQALQLQYQRRMQKGLATESNIGSGGDTLPGPAAMGFRIQLDTRRLIKSLVACLKYTRQKLLSGLFVIIIVLD